MSGNCLIPRDANREGAAAPFPGIDEITLLRERHQRGFPAVPHRFRHHVADLALLPLEVLVGGAGRGDGCRELVVALDRLGGQIGERFQPRAERLDGGFAVVIGTPPWRVVIAPLTQSARRHAQPLDRAIIRIVVESPSHRPAQRSTHAFARVAELFVQPRRKHLVEQRIRLRVGQHRKCRIDPRLDRTLPQQVGAEGVNGADVRFFEIVDRGVEQRAGCRVGGARSLELFAEAQLQFAGSLLAEGDGDDLADGGALVADQRDDPAHELGGLAGAGGRFDDQRLVELARDQLAVFFRGCPALSGAHCAAPARSERRGRVMACPSARRDRRRASRPCGGCGVLPGCRTPPGSRTTRTSSRRAAPPAPRCRWLDR